MLAAEIKTVPAAGQWSELSWPNKTAYRSVRYDLPPGSLWQAFQARVLCGSREAHRTNLCSLSARNLAVRAGRQTQRRAGRPNCRRPVRGDRPGGKGVVPSGDHWPAGRRNVSADQGEHAPSMPVLVIRYTTDGTLPTATTGQVYSAPFSIDKTTAITAVAFSDGLAPSPGFDAGTVFAGSASQHAALWQQSRPAM